MSLVVGLIILFTVAALVPTMISGGTPDWRAGFRALKWVGIVIGVAFAAYLAYVIVIAELWKGVLVLVGIIVIWNLLTGAYVIAREVKFWL